MKSLGLSLLTFVVIYFLIRAIVKYVKKRVETNDISYNAQEINKISKLVGMIVFIILMVFNVLVVLEILGVNAALLMAGLSLGIAFSLETVISNMIAGIILLTNKKVKIGELLEIEGDLNIYGIVKEINIRYTVIQTLDNRKIIIPNTTMSKTPIKTLSQEDLIRVGISTRIPRYADISQVKDLIKQVVNGHEQVINPEYTNTMITNFDDRGIQIKTFFFLNPKVSKGGLHVKSQMRRGVLDVFKQYGIKIPYKHITIGV